MRPNTPTPVDILCGEHNDQPTVTQQGGYAKGGEYSREEGGPLLVILNQLSAESIVCHFYGVG